MPLEVCPNSGCWRCCPRLHPTAAPSIQLFATVTVANIVLPLLPFQCWSGSSRWTQMWLTIGCTLCLLSFFLPFFYFLCVSWDVLGLCRPNVAHFPLFFLRPSLRSKRFWPKGPSLSSCKSLAKRRLLFAGHCRLSSWFQFAPTSLKRLCLRFLAMVSGVKDDEIQWWISWLGHLWRAQWSVIVMVNCRNPCGAFEGHSAAPLKGAAKRDSFGEWQKSMNQWPEHMLHPLDFLRKNKRNQRTRMQCT